MNRALWRKALSDMWVQLLVSSLFLAGFSWLFLWILSLFKADFGVALLKAMPGFMQRMLGFPIPDLVTPTGWISIIFVHIVILLVCGGWAVGRGSDPICGEIGRGTMDLLVTLPVWRLTLIVIPAVAATLGAALLAASIMLGIALGLNTVVIHKEVSLVQFTPGAINLFSMIFCLTGITTLLSSISHDRWRTIAMAVGLYLVSLIIETICRVWPAGAWLHYCNFLCTFKPQELIVLRDNSLCTQVIYNAVLLGIGLLSYAAGTLIFSRRDVPTAR
ncbi:MAG: ABC transporter permease subunit [Thermoguttaceae bacterium]|jgi:ABC-2 type transport system permease protein